MENREDSVTRETLSRAVERGRKYKITSWNKTKKIYIKNILYKFNNKNRKKFLRKESNSQKNNKSVSSEKYLENSVF